MRSLPTPDRNGPRPVRPLLVSADPDVLDDVLRLAAGADLDVAPDPAAARRWWATASVVVVGPDAGGACVQARLPRRPGIVVLACPDDAGVWERAVHLGAERVLLLPDDEERLSQCLGDAAEGGGQDGRVLAVVGGRGGAGATTTACALAVTAARSGRRVLLVDADPLGGGIDLVFGAEQDSGLRWRDLGGTRGRLPSAALAEALPRREGLSVLSWDRGAGSEVAYDAMVAVLAAGRRAHDLVVVDLPRTVDEGARAVLEAAEPTLLVVPAEVRATAAAARVAAAVGALTRDLRLVVRVPGPAGLEPGAVGAALGLPLAATLRSEPGTAALLERGEAPARRGRGPLADVCGRLLDDLVQPRVRAA